MGRKSVKKVYNYYIEEKIVATGTMDEIEKITNRSGKSIRAMANYYEKTVGNNKQRLEIIGECTEKTETSDAHDRLLEIVGYNAKRLRKSKRLSQKKLAEKLGVHQFQVSQLENGHTATLYTVAKLIAFYEIEPIEMFEDWLDEPMEGEDDEYEI